MGISDFTISALFDLGHTRASAYLQMYTYPWEAVKEIRRFLYALRLAIGTEYEEAEENVFFHRTAEISPDARVEGPCIVGAESKLGQCVLRGGVLIGEGCHVGNFAEVKESILFDGARVPHLSYVGNSVLGYRAHLGAGAILSNLKSDRSEVTVSVGGEKIPTHLEKCGSFLGDGAEIGCGAVLCPGTVVGKNTRIYPLVLARGAYPSGVIVKK